MITCSWIILTFNRCEIVKKSVTHNMANAGDTWEEIIYCDNGSTDGVRDFMLPFADVAILNKENLGVAKGYNRAMGLATKDYIVITGCDMLLQKNWLRDMKTWMTLEFGIGCIYSKPLEQVPERIRPPIQNIHGLTRVMPIERRIFPRAMLADVGYFPEDLGLYGHDDILLAARAEQLGYFSYLIPGHIATPLDSEGTGPVDGTEYQAFKRREADAPEKIAVIKERRDLGYPRFSPFL